jgi:hypothetical protein
LYVRLCCIHSSITGLTAGIIWQSLIIGVSLGAIILLLFLLIIYFKRRKRLEQQARGPIKPEPSGSVSEAPEALSQPQETPTSAHPPPSNVLSQLRARLTKPSPKALPPSQRSTENVPNSSQPSRAENADLRADSERRDTVGEVLEHIQERLGAIEGRVRRQDGQRLRGPRDLPK